MTKNIKKISFQGAKGAYSDMACRAVFPDFESTPYTTFEEAFSAVTQGHADLAMIPVDNTNAGRVADVHHLMLSKDLFIIGEHFQPIHHALLGTKGASLEKIEHVHSHVHAIPQCRKKIQELGIKAHIHADTAGAAEEIARRKDPAHSAIASELAAELYGLDILERNIQDEDHNTTRFLVLGTEPDIPPLGDNIITSLIFEVRNIPAALYKSLGGFATAGLSFTKLETYVDPQFQTAKFYCDIEGHPESEDFKLALEELGFYAADVKFLGTYPAHAFRQQL